MLKVIYLGLMYDMDKEEYYIRQSNNGIQGAVNTFQHSFVDGLIEQDIVSAIVINTVPIGTFPLKYKKLIIKSREWNYRSIKCLESGFVNFPILKMKCREYKIEKKIKEIISEYPNEKVYIIAYSLYLPFLKICKKIKKHYSNINFTFIVPDLPSNYGILPSNKIKRFIYKAYGEETLNLCRYIDSFILLTEKMKMPLKVGKRNSVIIEGITRTANPELISIKNNNNKKIIFYSGTLMYEFGIKNLLDAFELISGSDFELWICGSGEADKEIERLSTVDNRIKFFGYLPKEKTLQMQRQATVLINPRQNKGEYVKYSFPSKTMEYLLSGIPMVGYKLDGIPDEYDQFIFYVSDNSKEALKNKLIEICNMSYEERKKIGQLAREFVIENKNSKSQVNKVIEMLRKS